MPQFFFCHPIYFQQHAGYAAVRFQRLLSQVTLLPPPTIGPVHTHLAFLSRVGIFSAPWARRLSSNFVFTHAERFPRGFLPSFFFYQETPERAPVRYNIRLLNSNRWIDEQWCDGAEPMRHTHRSQLYVCSVGGGGAMRWDLGFFVCMYVCMDVQYVCTNNVWK